MYGEISILNFDLKFTNVTTILKLTKTAMN